MPVSVKSLSKSKTSTWGKIFPRQIGNVLQSRKMIKKLMVISLSTIAYLRFKLPENCFLKVDLDGMQLVLFKEDSDSHIVKEMCDWLKVILDAINNGSLNELQLMISSNGEDHNDVYEMYNFKVDNAERLVVSNSSTSSPGVFNRLANLRTSSISSSHELYQNTQSLIRNILVSSGAMGNLPPNAYVTMKLEFNMNLETGITPEGFHCSSPLSRARLFNHSPSAIPLGNIDTQFQVMTAQMNALAMGSSSAAPNQLSTPRSIGCSGDHLIEGGDQDRATPKDLQQGQVHSLTGLAGRSEVCREQRLVPSNEKKLESKVFVTPRSIGCSGDHLIEGGDQDRATPKDLQQGQVHSLTGLASRSEVCCEQRLAPLNEKKPKSKDRAKRLHSEAFSSPDLAKPIFQWMTNKNINV